MVRNPRRRHERAVKLPVEFAQRMAFAESRGSTIWRVARSENDFASFLPALEEIIELKREEAELVGYDGEAYDALLDEFEPGMTAARLEPLLGELRDETLSLLGEIQAARQLPPAPFEGRSFPADAQWALHDRGAPRPRLRPGRRAAGRVGAPVQLVRRRCATSG